MVVLQARTPACADSAERHIHRPSNAPNALDPSFSFPGAEDTSLASLLQVFLCLSAPACPDVSTGRGQTRAKGELRQLRVHLSCVHASCSQLLEQLKTHNAELHLGVTVRRPSGSCCIISIPPCCQYLSVDEPQLASTASSAARGSRFGRLRCELKEAAPVCRQHAWQIRLVSHCHFCASEARDTRR